MILEYTLIAYLTNASCTLSKYLKPHALSNKWLGPGKTLEGILIGLNAGLISSLILKLNFRISITVIIASLIGDLMGSFIKRRIKIKDVPVLDQTGFLVIAYYALSLITEINFHYAIILLTLTYFIHQLSNKLAFKLKIKNVPY